MFFFHKQIACVSRPLDDSAHCVYLWKTLSIWALRGIILPVGILTEFFLFGGIILEVTQGNGVALGLRHFVVHNGKNMQMPLRCACSNNTALFFQRRAKLKSINFSSDLARYYYTLTIIQSLYLVSGLFFVLKSLLFSRILGEQLTVILNE